VFLLDTNVVSELRRSRAEPRVLAWAAASAPEDFFLSAITVLEIEQGAFQLKRRDWRRGADFESWLRIFVLPSFENRILAFDVAAAIRCASLHVPDPRQERDAMIAATALEHRLTVATRNVRDFAAMGVPLLNPWET